MRKLYWKFKKVFSQTFVFILLGYALFWLSGKIQLISDFSYINWLKLAYFFCLAIYILLFASTVRSLITNNVIQTYDPTSANSLKKLRKQKKYQLNGQLIRQSDNQADLVQEVAQYLQTAGYRQTSAPQLGIVFEKETGFLNWKLQRKSHRVFLLYRPLLNILIVDNILAESARYIDLHNQEKPVSQNSLILITDMKNEEEVLSAGTGIVNFISGKSTAYLYPIFVDIMHQHIFFPQDISLLPWYKQASRTRQLKQLKDWLVNR